MNTTKLKTFAAEARNTLKRGVMNRILTLGFDEQGQVVQAPQEIEGGAVFMGETLSKDFYNKWINLRQRIEEKSLREVLEEAAYTWFNRLMAIRIMQMNRLIDPVLDYRSDSVKLPILLTDAMRSALPAMPDDERDRLKRLLIDPTRTAEQFALLITAFCHNTPVIDRCFGKIADYTELLLPNDILEENGFLDRLNHTDFISEEDYKTPELIGWLYQFYISERKDEVFAKSGKYDPDEIPAATQIFTPNWIVKYMVQNTLGRIYLDNNPYEGELEQRLKYLVNHSTVYQPRVSLDYLRVELKDIKVADLACGSGHILNECFDLLLKMYVNDGYGLKQAIESIFKYNLTGIDLDTRAKQLASFALLLKACQKYNAFCDAHIMPRIYDMSGLIPPRYENLRDTLPHFFLGGNQKIITETLDAFKLMESAESLGSIMKFDISPETRNAIAESMERWERDGKDDFEGLFAGMRIILALTEDYSALVMNPPYMGSGRFDATLSKYVRDNYEEEKADLFAVFMQVAIDHLADNGKYGMINMHSWMFLSSFEKLRDKVLSEQTIDSLLHLGARTFDELSGEVVQNAAFVITKQKPVYIGHFSSPEHPEIPSCQAYVSRTANYFRLVDGRDCDDKEQMFRDAKQNQTKGIYFPEVPQDNFEEIPGAPLVYWASQKIQGLFNSNPRLEEILDPHQGMKTLDNERFTKYWTEVNIQKFSCFKGHKWYPFNKGGGYRKWFGLNDVVVNWEDDGREIKNLAIKKYKCITRTVTNIDSYFIPGITWSVISTGTPSFRYYGEGFLFSNSGQCMVSWDKDLLLYIIGFLNSKISSIILNALSPTIGFESGYLKKLPIIKEPEKVSLQSIQNCIDIAKEDWDAHETSWDFAENELVRLSKIIQYGAAWQGEEVKMKPMPLGMIVTNFKAIWKDKFMQLHDNEEDLNRQFIDIYGLQDELTPDVPLDEVTILQQGEISIGNNEIVWHDDVLMKQLISYAVGCWMGRYRLDKPGLHIAHTDATKEEIAPYEYNGELFVIDDDGIIPLMPKDSMFHDNAALRIADFVRQVFGTETQVENLNFIEQALGKSLEQYFIKDFWKDHKKMYQNRPIYWLFSSKKGAFQCIAYMHRMNKYTPEIVRQKYLLPHMDDLRKRIADMEQRIVDLNTQERRSLDTMQKQLAECMEYHDRLHPVADKQIDFDLDDGVVVNYAKFGDILAKLK